MFIVVVGGENKEMYIQLVDFCNMSCSHCIFDCKKNGKTMTQKTFYNALKIINGDYITLGGGEPTLHPNFMEFLIEAISMNILNEENNVFVATNGSNTDISLKLASLARRGIINAALSRDEYHDEIEYVVVKAFTKKNHSYSGIYSDCRSNDYREIRNVTGKEIKGGRSLRGRESCICSEIFIKPDGTIKGCGCKDSIVLGNVNGEYNIPDYWDFHSCYKEQEEVLN